MNFVPTGKAYNKAQLKYDLKQFFSKNKVKRYNEQANELKRKKKAHGHRKKTIIQLKHL